MLPGNVLSTIPYISPIIGARANVITGTLDYEDGGAALNDADLGLDYQVWTGTLVDNEIILTSPLTAPEVVYSGALITEFSFTFDQNMAPVIAYIQDEEAKIRWYDSEISDFTITVLGSSNQSPKVFLDDKRELERASSDVLLGYRLNGYLYYRVQRERFANEYVLAKTYFKLNKIGMGVNHRVQFVSDC